MRRVAKRVWGRAAQRAEANLVVRHSGKVVGWVVGGYTRAVAWSAAAVAAGEGSLVVGVLLMLLLKKVVGRLVVPLKSHSLKPARNTKHHVSNNKEFFFHEKLPAASGAVCLGANQQQEI